MKVDSVAELPWEDEQTGSLSSNRLCHVDSSDGEA